MGIFLNWFVQDRIKSKKADFRKGYTFAANALVNRGISPGQLERQANESDTGSTFASGIASAVNDHHNGRLNQNTCSSLRVTH